MNLKFNTKRRSVATIDHRQTYKKQSGGKGKFADIQFSIGPVEVPEGEEVKEGLGVRRQN